ncbi:hypothetical protein BST95_00765 [Halioglobus japonicus]|uniref:hypothetical protein n=1 Tax=Halioglobus japonicus TaxID=930805 RepID=UPI0009791D21|nr:hypothetical protein [Halioglobus japonicus]AQA16969.1 hypothetical protein BST95_00765 [Halioglobus japonicus]GHD21788.1 hypothetical protein GCM10007052_32990 [Halioglobus japonicus]
MGSGSGAVGVIALGNQNTTIAASSNKPPNAGSIQLGVVVFGALSGVAVGATSKGVGLSCSLFADIQ